MWYGITYDIVDGERTTDVVQAACVEDALSDLREKLRENDILEDDYSIDAIIASPHELFWWEVPEDKRHPESQHFL